MSLDWDKIKELREQFVAAREDYLAKQVLVEKARSVANEACQKVCELETELQNALIK